MSLSVPLESINPANGESFETYASFTPSELDTKIRFAEKLWEDWKLRPLSKRMELLDSLSEQLLKEREQLSLLITNEMGKPLNQAVQEIEKCILLCRYYREYSESFLSPREEILNYRKSYVQYSPLGGVLGVMPWNFPFWQVFRFAIPAFAAGNIVFLKHSENVTGCALALETLFANSGWPTGLFNTLLIEREQVKDVISDFFIKMVSFTGSPQTGRHIASLCGQSLKKSILELGGSDPYVILEDANLTQAAQAVVTSRFNNSGQSCVAAKRVIIEESVYEDFSQIVLNLMSNKTIFNPIYNPDVGPVAKKEFLATLVAFKDQALKEGAKLLYEKTVSGEEDKSGFYFPITVLGACTTQMDLAHQEVFGPLLPLFPVADEKAALKLANQTRYGLGAVVFTEDLEKGEKWAKDHFSAGSCFVNSMVKSNPALPFGGVGESGYGRELSQEGIKEFVNIKTVVIS